MVTDWTGGDISITSPLDKEDARTGDTTTPAVRVYCSPIDSTSSVDEDTPTMEGIASLCWGVAASI